MRIAEQLDAALAGRYVIDREIGSGAMAFVFRAHDVRHDRPVALKVLNPDFGATLGATRFLAEIRVTAHLQHPNLLPLFDSGDADGLLFYVMPFVDGESLRNRLEREQQLPIEDAIHIAVAVAGALEYAHKHGIIHRDLKPENILLQYGEPMVADFGIALAVARAGGERNTLTGMSVGTPQYMSPEQAAGDMALDKRSDIYSLAAVLHEMLAGDPPHRGTSVQTLVARILSETPPSVRIARPNVPQAVANAISRGLEKVPADRWPSARAFADALTVDRLVVAPPRAIEGVDGTGESRIRRRVIGAAPYALLALALGVGIAAWPRPQPQQQVAWFDLALRDSVAPKGPIALSPDGSVVAFVGSETYSLFVRQLDELSPRRIAGTEGADCPSFSPDGRWIAFKAGGRIRKVALRGGTPMTVVDSGGCAAWTARDDILFDVGGSLLRVSADGGPATVVARVDSSKRIRRLSISHALPDKETALLSVSESVMADWRIGVVSLRNGDISRVSPSSGHPQRAPQYSAGYLVYVENGSVMAAPFSLATERLTGVPVKVLQDSIVAFSASRSGDLAYVSGGRTVLTLVAASTSGNSRSLDGTTEALGRRTWAASVLDTAYYSWPRISPDGKHIALELSTGDFTWDIWVYDVVSRTVSPLTRHFSGVRPAGWTADGRSVVYIKLDSARLGAPSHLVSQPWDGSEPPRELMPLPANVHDATAGPPHGYVAITVIRPGLPMSIWLAPLDTPQAMRPFVTTEGEARHPRFSPDGTLLAYTSTDGGQREVYVRTVSGPATRIQISVTGGSEPVWSIDGSQLYYRASKHVMRARLSFEPVPRVIARDTLFRDAYAEHNFSSTQNYDVFPGGKELLMIRSTSGIAHAAVVRNWPQLLRQHASRR